jgi:hypothetical protein
MSFFEKLTTTFINLGMVLPMVATGMKSLETVFYLNTAAAKIYNKEQTETIIDNLAVSLGLKGKQKELFKTTMATTLATESQDEFNEEQIEGALATTAESKALEENTRETIKNAIAKKAADGTDNNPVGNAAKGVKNSGFKNIGTKMKGGIKNIGTKIKGAAPQIGGAILIAAGIATISATLKIQDKIQNAAKYHAKNTQATLEAMS